MGVQTLASRWLQEFISQHVLLAPPHAAPRLLSRFPGRLHDAHPDACPGVWPHALPCPDGETAPGVAMSAHHRAPAQPWVVRPLA